MPFEGIHCFLVLFFQFLVGNGAICKILFKRRQRESFQVGNATFWKERSRGVHDIAAAISTRRCAHQQHGLVGKDVHIYPATPVKNVLEGYGIASVVFGQ